MLDLNPEIATPGWHPTCATSHAADGVFTKSVTTTSNMSAADRTQAGQGSP